MKFEYNIEELSDLMKSFYKISGIRYILFDADFNKKPGEVIAIDDKGITVACKIGALIIKQLQLEGKNRMSAVEFARGYRVKTGDFFGDV